MSSNFRVERDFLGEKQIPADAYWGVHTARAVENFPISGTPISAMPDLIRAFGYVKKATTRTNAALGAIDDKRAAAIISACDELIAGRFRRTAWPASRPTANCWHGACVSPSPWSLH